VLRSLKILFSAIFCIMLSSIAWAQDDRQAIASLYAENLCSSTVIPAARMGLDNRWRGVVGPENIISQYNMQTGTVDRDSNPLGSLLTDQARGAIQRAYEIDIYNDEQWDNVSSSFFANELNFCITEFMGFINAEEPQEASAIAPLSPERRADLISYYPCGAQLSDGDLFEMSEWANGTKQDPCMVSASDFTELFVSDATSQDALAITIVRDIFAEAKPSSLFMQQVLLLGREQADGIWGPEIESRFEELLETYHAIGGIGPDWGVREKADVPRFLAWINEMDYANTTGQEYPD